MKLVLWRRVSCTPLDAGPHLSSRHSSRHASRYFMVFALSLVFLSLGGCGPGVGGSGTGEANNLTAYNATAASLCASEVAALLACPSASASPATPLGTAPVYLADTIDGRRVAVSAQGNLIEVNAPCARIQFRGQWGVAPGQAPRFYGFVDPDNTATPASLTVVAQGNGLLLTLVDKQGVLLLGPLLVTVRAAPAVPGNC